MAKARQLINPIKPLAQFHAYVLGGVIGILWGGKHTNRSNAISNPDLSIIVREYLTSVCDDDEWTKGRILDAMRYKKRAAIKAESRAAFPSLFPRNKRARPLGVPEELNDQEVSFDRDRIERWKQKVKVIKKEITMNENATAQETTKVSQPPVDRSIDVNGSNSNSRVTVNFFIPEGVNPETLTLENYREVTTKRFRMTKDQAKVRGLTREKAFVESKALAISQLGVI